MTHYRPLIGLPAWEWHLGVNQWCKLSLLWPPLSLSAPPLATVLGPTTVKRTKPLPRHHAWWTFGRTPRHVEDSEACSLSKPHDCEGTGGTRDKAHSGELQPLRVPTERWSEVTIDFVTKLPRTDSGFDSVFVAVDRATKMVHLVPCVEAISAKETAALYWKHVGCLHGVPKCLYSDRDRRFESTFWKSLWKILGSDLRFSTAYHPQTQGQVERMNAVF